MTGLSLPTVQVLERAFDILEALAASTSGLGISEIAGITHLPISTVHRLLKVLKKRGYVAQNAESRKYTYLQKAPPPPVTEERIEHVSGHAM